MFSFQDINAKMNLSADGSVTLMSDGRFRCERCLRRAEDPACVSRRQPGWNVNLFRVNPNGVDLTLQESSHPKYHSPRRQGLEKQNEMCKIFTLWFTI